MTLERTEVTIRRELHQAYLEGDLVTLQMLKNELNNLGAEWAQKLAYQIAIYLGGIIDQASLKGTYL